MSAPRTGQSIEEEETDLDYSSRRGSSEYGDHPMARRAPIGIPPGEPAYSRPLPKPQHQNLPIIPVPVQTPTPPPSKNEEIVAKFELIASIVIPILFVLFNFLYWPWIIISSEYYEQGSVGTPY